jgi:hypothetical protein
MGINFFKKLFTVSMILGFVFIVNSVQASVEFSGNPAQIRAQALAYKRKIQELVNILGVEAYTFAGEDFSTPAKSRVAGIHYKNKLKELLKIANEQGRNIDPKFYMDSHLSSTPSGYSSPIVGTPFVSRSPSSNNLSGMSGPNVSLKLFPVTPSKAQLETMDREQLKDAAISMQQQLEELQKASSTSTSISASSSIARHDTATAIDPSAQDRELNRVFNANRTMVEAYKTAVANGNLDGFWPVVKAEVIQKLTECINKIQPGGNDSVLLVQYASGLMYYAGSITKSVTKAEFLRNLALRIEALDFSKITLPADNESGLTQFKLEYMQEIRKAVNNLVDELVEGNGSAIILPNELQRNMEMITRIVTTDSRQKNVFKMALSVKGIEEKL